MERTNRKGGRGRYLLIDYEEHRWYTEQHFWQSAFEAERYLFEYQSDEDGANREAVLDDGKEQRRLRFLC